MSKKHEMVVSDAAWKALAADRASAPKKISITEYFGRMNFASEELIQSSYQADSNPEVVLDAARAYVKASTDWLRSKGAIP